MQDLQEVTHEIHYENYRSDMLGSQYKRSRENKVIMNGGENISDKDRILKEKEEEVCTLSSKISFMKQLKTYL
jgi:septin family protein